MITFLAAAAKPAVPAIVMVGVVLLWLVTRLWCDRLDRSRIAEYVAEHGGSVVEISWNPLGKGWFGSRKERIYEVIYCNRNGRTVTATCKTSMFSGVYWTDGPAPSSGID